MDFTLGKFFAGIRQRCQLGQPPLTQSPSETVGQYGERLAVQYLCRKGYRIIGRNVRNAVGEIDCIAVQFLKKKRIVVFVEVKTRVQAETGAGPSDAVDEAKQKQITNAALCYLRNKKLLEHPARLDVVEVILHGELDNQQPNAKWQPVIRHFENAFDAVGKFQMHH